MLPRPGLTRGPNWCLLVAAGLRNCKAAMSHRRTVTLTDRIEFGGDIQGEMQGGLPEAIQARGIPYERR